MQTVSVNDTVTTAATGTSSDITVNPAALASITISPDTATITAGDTQAYTAEGFDTFGNSRGDVTADTTFSISPDGTCTLADCGSTVAGAHTVTGTDGAFTDDASLTVNPAALASITISPDTATITAGDTQAYTAEGFDAFGNSRGDVTADTTFSISPDGSCTLADCGSTVAGAHTVTGTDGAFTDDASLTVNPAATSTLVVAGFTDPTTAGDTHTFSVTAKDAYGNTTPAYTGTVHFTSSDGQAVLPADYAFTGAGLGNDNGSHTFSATLKTAGEQSISATDTADGSINGSQTAITVNPAATSTLVVAGFTDPTTAGDTHTFSVTAKDAYGNTTPAYTGTVHFTSSDGQAVLPADYAFTGAGLGNDNGSHTFSATLKTAGEQSISATDTADGSINGSQTAITVNPAATSTLVVAGFTDPTTAGDTHTFSVTAKDAYGNTTPAYTGTVHFTSSDGQAVLPADYAFTGAGLGNDNGSHTFSATLKTAGEQSISATDTADGSINGSQTAITVNPAATSTLVVAGFTDPTTAGDSHSFSVTAKDAYGNTTPAYTGTVHFTSSDGQAVLPADYTFTGAGLGNDNGSHTFSATLKTAGEQSITATDTADGSITGSQTAITVNPAATSTLVVAGFTDPTTAGDSHTFTVTAKDAYGNTTPAYTGTVHFTSSDVQAVLPADYTFTGPARRAAATPSAPPSRRPASRSITATDTVDAPRSPAARPRSRSTRPRRPA